VCTGCHHAGTSFHHPTCHIQATLAPSPPTCHIKATLAPSFHRPTCHIQARGPIAPPSRCPASCARSRSPCVPQPSIRPCMHPQEPGFPVYFDINLSAERAQAWADYLDGGLYFDKVGLQGGMLQKRGGGGEGCRSGGSTAGVESGEGGALDEGEGARAGSCCSRRALLQLARRRARCTWAKDACAARPLLPVGLSPHRMDACAQLLRPHLTGAPPRPLGPHQCTARGGTPPTRAAPPFLMCCLVRWRRARAR